MRKMAHILNTMAAIVALCDGSAYGADFGEEYKSGKHSDSNTEHLAELKSVVRYRSGTIAKLGTFGQILPNYRFKLRLVLTLFCIRQVSCVT